MNCLDFRRRLMSDPFEQDTSLAAHEDACGACAAFARELRADEVRMRALLNDIDPPSGMADRIQLAVGFERRSVQRQRWWYAAAAGVLMAVGVSMVSLWTTSVERGGLTLAQSVIHHIQDEAAHLHEAGVESGARVAGVFQRFGAQLAGDIGPVLFAAECLMRQRNGVHLVLPGKRGAITAFFMPGEMTLETLPVESERFIGEIVPTAWGSIAVVGENGEVLDGLGERLAAAVEWPTADPGVARSELAGGHLVGRDVVGRPHPAAGEQDS